MPVNDQSALEYALQEALRRDWDRQTISAWGRARSWEQVAAEVFVEMQAIVKEGNGIPKARTDGAK